MKLFNKFYKYLHKNNIKGKDRFYTFLKRYGLKYHILDTTSTGVKMNLNPKSYVDAIILQSGSYEMEVIDALCENVDNQTILWDIGANIGFHSLSFKIKFPQNTVYSFEPDFKNFKILKQNQILNKLDLNLMNIALSDKFDCIKLFSVEGNNGMSTIQPWHEFKWDAYPHHILATTGDYLIENNIVPCPSIIKLDVEGHELSVLRGLSKALLTKKIKKIIFEAPNDFLEVESEIKTLLNKYNYEFAKLVRVEDTAHDLSNFMAYFKVNFRQ